MISRNEALEFNRKNEIKGSVSYLAAQENIHMIYDSIGSCGSCDRFRKIRGTFYGRCFLISNYDEALKYKDNYCSSFIGHKVKEDEE